MTEIDSKELDRIVKAGKIIFTAIGVILITFIFYFIFFA